MAGNHSRVLREANKYLILQCITNYGPLTTEDIVKRLNISRPTVVNLLKELEAEESIVRGGHSVSTGGRAAVLYKANAEGAYAVGVDFEFPLVRVAVAGPGGDIRNAFVKQYSMNTHAETVKKDLPALVERAIKESGLARDRFVGVGLGMPGTLDITTGTSLSVERIDGWENVPIRAYMEEALRMPVYLRNDVHLLGLVEQRKRQAEDLHDFIYIGLRSGIGSVIYKDGKPFKGERGNAGFIGHTTLNPFGPMCRCGNRGCLEVYAGELALTQAYAAGCHEAGRPEPLAEDIHMNDLLDLAGNADEIALGLVKDAGYHLGIAITNMVKMLEISTIIVGCCPSLDDSSFMKELHRAVKEYLPKGLARDVRVSTGQTLSHEYALGGCFFAFDHMYSKPKLSLSV